MRIEGVLFALLVFGGFLTRPLPAQETVTIPKSRLEELQRAEEELKKLKGQQGVESNKPAAVIQEQHSSETTAKPMPEPKVTHVSPVMSSLPQLKEGETVEAVDLVNHYRTDAAAADRRYLKKKFCVRGQIAGFEKRLFIREYKIILKTDDQDARVICTVFPPEKYEAVFRTSNGAEMTGLVGETRDRGVQTGETRERIAKVGETVTVAGECRGLRENTVVLTGCGLRLPPSQPH